MRAGGNQVVRERLAGQRVGDSLAGEEFTEIARSHPCGRDGAGGGAAFADDAFFKIAEEEDLAAAVEDLGKDDGTTEGEAELVALEGRLRLLGSVEEVLGVELLVAEELEGGAVEVVGPGLEVDVDDAAHGAAVLGGVGVGLDLELLDGVDGGLDHLAAALGAGELVGVVVDAVDHEVVLGDLHAAGAEAAVAAAAGGLDGAGREQGELVVLAAVEGHVDDAAVVDHLALAGFDGVELQGVGGDDDVLGDGADFKGEIEFGPLIDREDDAGTSDGLEALLLDGDGVGAGLQQGNGVVAIGVGLGLSGDVGGDVGDGNACRGHDGAG